MSSISPFTVAVPPEALDDLRRRLEQTIWPSEVDDAGWGYGPAANYMKEMVEYLLTGYDWRAHEAELNRYPQFTTAIDNQNVHFIHATSTTPDATPLLLIHGWPGSIVEFLDIIAPLTDPAAHGGNPDDAFHVVVPSLPGYGFSGPTHEGGWNNGRMAKALVTLMDRLGYDRYGVQGGDAGAIIGPDIARLAPKQVIGVHVNAATMGFMPMGPIDPADAEEFSDAEKERAERMQRFMAEHFGFNVLQSTRPQALAYGISDSPAGLLAWNSELFTSFGDTPQAIDRDKVLTNFLIYWFTGTAASSIRLYYENAHDSNAWAPKSNSGVPTAVAVFKRDEVPIRRYAEPGNTIARWTEFDKGGHYAVMEEPELWTGDVRAFFNELRGP